MYHMAFLRIGMKETSFGGGACLGNRVGICTPSANIIPRSFVDQFVSCRGPGGNNNKYSIFPALEASFFSLAYSLETLVAHKN